MVKQIVRDPLLLQNREMKDGEYAELDRLIIT